MRYNKRVETGLVGTGMTYWETSPDRFHVAHRKMGRSELSLERCDAMPGLLPTPLRHEQGGLDFVMLEMVSSLGFAGARAPGPSKVLFRMVVCRPAGQPAAAIREIRTTHGIGVGDSKAGIFWILFKVFFSALLVPSRFKANCINIFFQHARLESTPLLYC